MSLFKLTKKERNVIKQEKKSRVKFLEKGSNVYLHNSRSAFLGEKRLIKNIFLNYCNIFDNKYIKTLLNSNKILSENFKPITSIKLEIIDYIFIYIDLAKYSVIILVIPVLNCVCLPYMSYFLSNRNLISD